ncbi:MAG: GNAT family N-acetyltransferase [Bryobacterales bacterium]|nr:GNAT family N-acetyltransferase [Bryobacteraceae bacterium]MDW8355886.1 GNAT family N-acetyltransferase [Bryobacterales bacterium]
MPLRFRVAEPADYEEVERLLLASFEPVTWFRRVDEQFGPLNGRDWRERWRLRVAHIFRTQTVLLGEDETRLVAVATGDVDPILRLGYIELLAVAPEAQGRGYGREMLRGMLRHMKQQGALYASLDCLAENDRANSLYRSEGFREVACHIRWLVRIP